MRHTHNPCPQTVRAPNFSILPSHEPFYPSEAACDRLRFVDVASPLVLQCGMFGFRGMPVTLEVYDAQAWREFRGTPSSKGLNETTHLAKIADTTGKLHSCYVKLIKPTTNGLLCEAIGWTLALYADVPRVEFACVVMVPIRELEKHMALPTWLAGYDYFPAWCAEIVKGNSLAQVCSWQVASARASCLKSIDTQKMAAFDFWADNMDRNFGNVIRSDIGRYVAIDHETLLHEILWLPLGIKYEPRRLFDNAKVALSKNALDTFMSNMLAAATTHQIALNNAEAEIKIVIQKLLGVMPGSSIGQQVYNFLLGRSDTTWLPNQLEAA